MYSQVRVSAIFAFVSFVILLSVSGVPAHIEDVKVSSLPLNGACAACLLKTWKWPGLCTIYFYFLDFLLEAVL